MVAGTAEAGEVVMADAEQTSERAVSSTDTRERQANQVPLMEKGQNLLFRWSIYATLNLVDDPAMLAIMFT